MAVWPVPEFTSDIYHLRNPKSTLHLAALLRISIPSRLDRRLAQPYANPPPFARTALVEALVNLGARSVLIVFLLSLIAGLGCFALDASPPAAQQATGAVATRTTRPFRAVPAGNSQLRAAHSPRTGRDTQGRVAFASNLVRPLPSSALMRRTIGRGRITLNPASIRFGNVPVGQTQTLTATLSNTGQGNVTLTHASISGTGFALTGLGLPLTLGPRQSAAIGVSFTPAAGGNRSGTISVVGKTTIRFAHRSRRRGEDFPTDVATTTINTVLRAPISGVGTGAGQLAVSPAVLALGRVKIGASQTQSATLVNSGSSSVTLKQATVTGRGFQVSGLNFPLTLSPGQKKSFAVTFTPQATGNAAGSVAVTSDTPNSFVSVSVSAVAVGSSTLISNPASLNFGTARTGQPQNRAATLTNAGTATVVRSQASIAGTGFTVNGLKVPLTLAPGQSAGFSVGFKSKGNGAANGTLSLISDASNATLTIPLAATAAAPAIRPSLNPSPFSLSFGSVKVGTPKTVSETLTNSGTSNIIISNANVSGTGFALSGWQLPATLTPGQSAALSVTFTPQSAGSANGSLSIVSDAANASLAIPLSANVATGGALSTSDSSLDFSGVPVGRTNTLSETLTNSGGSSVTVTQASVTGASFKITGLSLPLTLSPGQSFTFGAVFAPTTGGTANGSIAVVSDASNPNLTISMVGTATVSGQLAVSPAALNFGNVVVGQSKSLTASLTASTSSITITNANLSTSEFAVSGLTFPLTLTAGKSVSFTVRFAPQSSGVAAANASFASNASNSSLLQSLAGSGTPAPQHSVALSWNTSPSTTVVGYNVYRGVTAGGPYSRINLMNLDNTYTDGSVQGGQTYFYVTTAVDATGKESTYSNQTQANVPTP